MISGPLSYRVFREIGLSSLVISLWLSLPVEVVLPEEFVYLPPNPTMQEELALCLIL